MSDPPVRRAPPGWYSEQGRRGFRYWDGESWAEPMASPLGHPHAADHNRTSTNRQRAGLAFMGAAVGLLVVGLMLPWAEGDSGNRGLLDGDLPWLVGVGGVADTWLLIPLAASIFWALLVTTLVGISQPMPLIALVGGLVVMGFCVAEALALDDNLAGSGTAVGVGVLLAYAGGACSSIGGALLRPAR